MFKKRRILLPPCPFFPIFQIYTLKFRESGDFQFPGKTGLKDGGGISIQFMYVGYIEITVYNLKFTQLSEMVSWGGAYRVEGRVNVGIKFSLKRNQEYLIYERKELLYR